ncbi:MAG: glutamine--fructose-6-phosphate aminotransferase, partial [Candidatus Thermoplasmatota archaeon]|nr:glutamine--fructose-6-phosphate aminotransferase [Candidatus Thermoplasmatota archaeon]
MCGIIGYFGGSQAAPIILSGLRRLEYRGYDSAGVAIPSHGKLQLHKTRGTMDVLVSSMPEMKGTMGIGHTRWATHGAPSTVNAHPHID